MKKFADKKRVRGPTFKEKNKIYFFKKNTKYKYNIIWITRLINKLDFAKLKPFKIVKVLGLVTFQLDLPDSMRITKIRHNSVLKLADLEISLMEDILDINPKS